MSEYKPNKMEQEILTSVKSISISLKEIKSIVPVVSSTLKAINESIYDS